LQVPDLHGVINVDAGWDDSLAILRSPISVPKPPMCAGTPSLSAGNRFPRTVRLNTPRAIAVSEQIGQVFVLNGTGYDCQPSMTILDARTAAPLRVVPIGQDPYGEDPYAVLVADQLGRTFVVRRGNMMFQRKDGVSVLDTRSGRLLYSTTVAQGSQSVAVERALSWARTIRGGISSSTSGRARCWSSGHLSEMECGKEHF
jgi:DNA-binding beta-propeller fold protein YncE